MPIRDRNADVCSSGTKVNVSLTLLSPYQPPSAQVLLMHWSVGRIIMESSNSVQPTLLPDQSLERNGSRDSFRQIINPKRAPHFMKTEQIPNRHVFCINYDLCLDLAIAKRWDSFTCEDCSNYDFVKCSPAKWLADNLRCWELIDALERWRESQSKLGHSVYRSNSMFPIFFCKRHLKLKGDIMTDSDVTTIDQLAIKVKLKKDTMELFAIPLPRRQHVFFSTRSDPVRVLDNPLKENLRNYVAWGKFKVWARNHFLWPSHKLHLIWLLPLCRILNAAK